MTCENTFYKELARLEGENAALREQLIGSRALRRDVEAARDDERKHRLALQDTLDTWQKQIRTLQDKVEAAFKAGYHCTWHVNHDAYCFDPNMSPGDSDGAYKAWLATLQVGP
jgi:hypothetical protein